jgi:hypothetical protein
VRDGCVQDTPFVVLERSDRRTDNDGVNNGMTVREVLWEYTSSGAHWQRVLETAIQYHARIAALTPSACRRMSGPHVRSSFPTLRKVQSNKLTEILQHSPLSHAV